MSTKKNQTIWSGRLNVISQKAMYLSVLLVAILVSFTIVKSRVINGSVYDAQSKNKIAGVRVTETGTPNTTYTDWAGRYKITMTDDSHKLIFSHLGYKPDTLTTKPDAKLDAYLQKETIITTYKADTVAYQASNYTITNGLTGKVAGLNVSQNYNDNDKSLSEVVLKRVPGIDVDANGNVSVQGQAVARVRVNGKDYVGSNIQQAIKNLPADIVEKIQMIDDYGDQAAKTGIKSGDPDKILNVIVPNYTPTPINTESYDRIVENKFINPLNEPLSTFSADVDAASYTNVRRYINSGQLPPKNAVRIEEMINYFNYNLPSPHDGKPVAITTELSAAPWNAQHQLIRIGLKAKDVEKSKLPSSNLVFLIDVSGSMMEPNKLPLVQASMKMLVDQLREKDHVTIVVYAGNAGLVLPSTAGSDKQKIKEAIDKLVAGGSTAGGAGIKLAYKIARENFIKGGNNRIILSTDGDFNVGASSDKDMESLIEEERGDGISISILGFGMGNYKDSKMERMADKGHGNYAYIDNITEATKSMVTEFGGTLFTVAKDVKLQVEFNPAKVSSYRLLGYEDRLMPKEDFNNDTKLGGDMGVGHVVTALYEIIPVGVKDNFSNSVDPLKYQQAAETKANRSASNEVATVKFRYKEPDGDVSKLESVAIGDKPEDAGKTSQDFKFAAAVAEYGLLLRNSQYKQNADFDQLISMAKSAKGEDDNGYRAEFIRLAESTKNLMTSKAVAVKSK